MITRKLECRKFVPNIFNKRKCSNCFRQREEHNADALSDFNQMAKKILKCGYLFVAPDWDFTNPIYKTKRWQRRWFVLFDDGQLTYAVDDHIDTVPQGIVDITKTIDICSAENTTGHPHSLCLTESDRRTYIKGTFPEEIKWWHNELRSFVKTKEYLRKDTFYRDKRTPICLPDTTGGSYEDVVDFGKNFDVGYKTEVLESTDPRPHSFTCANNYSNNKEDLNLKESSFSRRAKTLNRSLTLPIYANIPQRVEKSDLTSLSSSGHDINSGPQTPQERGDPDGDCGVDKIPINCMTRNSEYSLGSLDEMIKLKKGWLYKKDSCGVWMKHWFSLNGAALFYYRDAIAEERGILDGVLDLNNITDIKVDNNNENKFSFVLTTWDNRRITLAALTMNACTNWLTIIKRVIGQDDNSHSQKTTKDEENLSLHVKIGHEQNECTPVIKNKSNGHKSSMKTYMGESQKQLKRMGSVSDLTDIPDINPCKVEKHVLAKEYNELKYRFQKIIEELRIIKKELKDAYYIYDTLEIDYKALKVELEKFRSEEQARVSMMAERIEDLTNKYTAAEKNARNLKIKLSRSERRRSVSLKGRDYPINKEQDVDHSENNLNDIQLIESKLNYKLCTLLQERQMLIEKNELSIQKKKELLLHRLAYESVCFENLKMSIQPKRLNFLNSKDFLFLNEIEVKIAELNRKVNDLSTSNHQKTNDILTNAPIKLAVFDIIYLVSQTKNHSSVLEKLILLQKGLVTLADKYKKQKIECLLYALAVEHTNSREDVLQNIINEITNSAMKKTNEDLIKYEIDHLMALLSRSCDTLLMSPLPLTMFSSDMYYFEVFVDKIHECLKRELAVWVSELQSCFDKILIKIKEGQWCFQLEQERKCGEKKFVVSDLSNVIVLKSVIDGQILFMTSDHSSEVPNINDKNTFFLFLEELKNQYLIMEKSFDCTKNYTADMDDKSIEIQDSELFKYNDNNEKTLQKRYCEEIEQLRTLCQRGMDAMRASHKAVITEMEERHRKQIQQLMIEKEQALAEETKATLAALEAMQKAHKSEVQREILRFKNEFIRQEEEKLQRTQNNAQELEETIRKLELKNQRLRTSFAVDESCHPLKDSPVKARSMRIYQKSQTPSFESNSNTNFQPMKQEAVLSEKNYLERYECLELNI